MKAIPRDTSSLGAAAHLLSGISELITDLASPANDTAHRALATYDWNCLAKGDATNVVTSFVSFVTDANLLPRRLQADRMRQLLAHLPGASLDVDGLINAARNFPPHLRATVAAGVPEASRPYIYRSRNASLPFVQESSIAAGGKGSEDGLASEPTRTSHRSEGHAPPEYTTVLVLSNPDRQDANIKTLGREGLEVRVVESLDELEATLLRNNDICLCVVDGSVLRTLHEAAQRRLFSALAEYSTFLRIRVEDSGLKLGLGEVRQLLKTKRALTADVPAAALCFDGEGTIRPSEVEDLKGGHDHLRSHESARFVIGELTLQQAQLLVAAARARMETQGLTGPLEIRTLTTRFLSGGRSGARLATVKVNDSRATLVARVTTTKVAIDEMQRFKTFIQPWDRQLQPELHYHREDAVILNALVAGDAAQLQPAEMLEDRIAALWNDQWLGFAGDEEIIRRAEALASGLEWAAKRLLVLNSERADSSFPSVANPSTDQIGQLESKGFDAGLGADAVRARYVAFGRFDQLAHTAVIHGDIHLRNMLVDDESRVHFIDYGCAGPGHPALDLVRLELSLYTGQVRQFEGESACTELQEALSVQMATLDVLRLKFGPFFQCSVNEVCARVMVAARDSAIEAVRVHGGNVRDYQAAKYLVGWQHIGMIGVHTGLARSVINSLTSEILSW